MKITIKTLSGQNFPLDVEANETTFEVAQQKLLRKGALLADEKTAAEIGIQEGDFLVVMVNVKKQQPTAAQQQAPQQQQQQAPQQPPQQPPVQPSQYVPIVAPQVPVVGANMSTGLLSGAEFEAAINEMVSMGFSKEEAQAAMRAAYNNPDRAIEYLLNGIPQSSEISQPPVGTGLGTGVGTGLGAPIGTGVGTGLGTGLGANTGGQGLEALAGLANNPQLQQIRQLYQQNPQAFMQILPQLMQTIGQQNPQLYALIQSNPEAFLSALLGGQGGAAQQQGNNKQMNSISIGGANTVQIQLTPQEKEQIDNMVAMGFTKTDSLEAFLACDRNAEMALNYLFERQATGELLSQHIEREQNNPDNGPEDDYEGGDDDNIYQ